MKPPVRNSARAAAAAERKATEAETMQRQLAEANAQRAGAVSMFLVDAFRSPDPHNDGRTITIAEVLDRSAKNLQDKFADDPRTRADLLSAIGESYYGLGLYREAIPLLESARELRVSALGKGHVDTLATDSKLVSAYLEVDRAKDATVLAEEILRLGIDNLQTDPPAAQPNMGDLTRSFWEAGSLKTALPLLQETVQLRRDKLGPQHPAVLDSMNELAWAYYLLERNSDALPLAEETVRLRKAVLGTGHHDTLSSMEILSNAYRRAGRPADRLRVCEEAVELSKATLGPFHPETITLMEYLVNAYSDSGQQDEAVRLCEEMVKISKATWDRITTLPS